MSERFKTKRSDNNLNRNNECVLPWRAGEILQEVQPPSTAVCKAGGDHMRESQQTSSEEKEEARDVDPDVEAQQDFWNIMRDSKNRNHVAQRTKLFVPKDDFPMPLN